MSKRLYGRIVEAYPKEVISRTLKAIEPAASSTPLGNKANSGYATHSRLRGVSKRGATQIRIGREKSVPSLRGYSDVEIEGRPVPLSTHRTLNG